jgi:fatty acid amide hydrolase 2
VFGLQKKHTLPALSLALAERAPLKKPQHYIALGNTLRQEIKDEIGDDGILLFPSFTCVAPYHNQSLLTNSLDFMHFAIINVLGFPSTQCPMGLSPQGLPTGVQVIANQNNDHLTIKFAEFLESNLIGWVPPS